jgi:hypothetical protein
MRCPRCGGTLTTFSVGEADRSAVVCDACGFADVSASHRPEEADRESWESAMARFEETRLPPDRTCRTGRTRGVGPPDGEATASIDPGRLDESVSVGVSLDGTDDDGE